MHLLSLSKFNIFLWHGLPRKERLLVIEIVNLIIESLIFQNRLSNGVHSISDIKLPSSQYHSFYLILSRNGSYFLGSFPIKFQVVSFSIYYLSAATSVDILVCDSGLHCSATPYQARSIFILVSRQFWFHFQT